MGTRNNLCRIPVVYTRYFKVGARSRQIISDRICEQFLVKFHILFGKGIIAGMKWCYMYIVLIYAIGIGLGLSMSSSGSGWN